MPTAPSAHDSGWSDVLGDDWLEEGERTTETRGRAANRQLYLGSSQSFRQLPARQFLSGDQGRVSAQTPRLAGDGEAGKHEQLTGGLDFHFFISHKVRTGRHIASSLEKTLTAEGFTSCVALQHTQPRL